MVREGSPAKRAAIGRAALKVFLAEGYARAGVDAIAAEAGVSKRTVYDYYGGKEQLFLSTIAETRAGHEKGFEELLDETLDNPADLEDALFRFGQAFATALSRSEERTAIVRLMIAEAGHFPDLLKDRPTRTALADRLAALHERGLLDVPDPVEAAEFLGLLVTGPIQGRSWYGAVRVGQDEIDHLVRRGVRIFLSAYGK
ncbi:TetR/AcrR family transcriptional regulator [Kribbella sp. NPDC051952]|uniref:TetR/AcrR family transcriptional regulator n=1 Tax=Kribbella sp. NPDC051952 TaxID=3154851 RepID=UPI003428A26F